MIPWWVAVITFIVGEFVGYISMAVFSMAKKADKQARR